MYNGTEPCPDVAKEETFIGVFSSVGSVVLGIIGTLLATNKDAILARLQNAFSKKEKSKQKPNDIKIRSSAEEGDFKVVIGDATITVKSRANSMDASRSTTSSMETESPRDEDYREKETKKKKQKQHRRHKSR